MLDHPAILANDELAAATIEAARADDLEEILSSPRSKHWPFGPETTRSMHLMAGADPERAAAHYVEQGIARLSDVQLCGDVVSSPVQLMSIVETGMAAGSVELGRSVLAAALKCGVGKSLSTDQTLRAISILSRRDQRNDELLLPLVPKLSAERALELPISGFAKAGAKCTAARLTPTTSFAGLRRAAGNSSRGKTLKWRFANVREFSAIHPIRAPQAPVVQTVTSN